MAHEAVLQFLEAAAVEPWDDSKRAAVVTAARSIPAACYQQAISAGIWARFDGSIRNISRGVRECLLYSNRADQALLAVLYFALLASEDPAVRTRFASRLQGRGMLKHQAHEPSGT